MTQTQKLATTQVVEIAEAHANRDWVDDYLGSICSVCDAVIDALRSQPVSQQLTGSLELDYHRLMEKHNALHLNALSYRAANSILTAEVERLKAQAVNAPGWQIVPIEPTDAMLDAMKREAHSAKGAREKSKRMYAAMLEAATPAQQGEQL